MLNRKPLIVAALGATLAVGTLSTQAYANDDALLGALVGAGIGAAIGHNVHGRAGAVVGGAIGALAGAGIAASSDPYYDAGYEAMRVLASTTWAIIGRAMSSTGGKTTTDATMDAATTATADADADHGSKSG